jgi:hypothetical protein
MIQVLLQLQRVKWALLIQLESVVTDTLLFNLELS